jgi:hypothetical protein
MQALPGGSPRIPDSMESQQTKLAKRLLVGRLQVIAGVRLFPGLRDTPISNYSYLPGALG